MSEEQLTSQWFRDQTRARHGHGLRRKDLIAKLREEEALLTHLIIAYESGQAGHRMNGVVNPDNPRQRQLTEVRQQIEHLRVELLAISRPNGTFALPKPPKSKGDKIKPMTYNYYGDDGVKLTVNPDRVPLDETYLQMAELWGKNRSKANRLRVGALIVKGKRIISDGYNGMPAGMDGDDEICEHWEAGHERDSEVPSRLVTKPMVLHAEANAILKIAHDGGAGAAGATLYQSHSPCPECAKLIVQAGIKRVVYRHAYRLMGGVEMLRSLGVECTQLSPYKEPSTSSE